jgi:hypothetical protein
MGPERASFRRSARPANAKHARHVNAPVAGVADSDSATAPNGSNAWHEHAPGTNRSHHKLLTINNA